MTIATRIDREPCGRMLKMKEVVAETSLHRATIYRQIKAGTFPRGHRLSPKRVGWPERDIEAWKAGEYQSEN